MRELVTLLGIDWAGHGRGIGWSLHGLPWAWVCVDMVCVGHGLAVRGLGCAWSLLGMGWTVHVLC
jgi:hypothetical protein